MRPANVMRCYRYIAFEAIPNSGIVIGPVSLEIEAAVGLRDSNVVYLKGRSWPSQQTVGRPDSSFCISFCSSFRQCHTYPGYTSLVVLIYMRLQVPHSDQWQQVSHYSTS